MKNIQTGFTIVELMIVVAIIGVLASIAMPIYSDYVNRGKMSEPVSLLAGLRIPMQEYYMENGSWPTVERVGGKSVGIYTSIIIASTDPDNLYIEAELKGGDSTPLGGKKIRMTYYKDQQTWNWKCSTEGTDKPIPIQYLPSSCK